MSEILHVPSTDGVTVAVHDLGGDGPPALLAHATGFCGPVWRPLAAALGECHCFALDFRGHGRTPGPPGFDYSWDSFADDVLAVVDSLGLDRPLGVGHSKGGASLLLAEERRPGTFAALWCFEPVVFPPTTAAPGGENPLAAGALRRRPTFPSAQAALENFGSKPPMNAFDRRALEGYVEGGFVVQPDASVTLACSPETEAQVYRMGSQHHAWDRLAELDLPVTIVRGAVEAFGPSAFADQIAARIPHASLEIHDELGHFGPLEAPAAMAESVRRSISSRTD